MHRLIHSLYRPARLALPALAAVAFTAAPAFAQHSDVEFGYTDGKIEIEFGPEGQVFEGEFPSSGLFAGNTDDPGFASEPEEGLGVNPGDVIDYRVLGPLRFHDGAAFAPITDGTSITIADNPSGTINIDASTVGPVTGPGAIAEADGAGEVHAHIDFTLNDTAAAPGAYGILMDLTTDASGIGNSDPFYIVFNFGLEEAAFEGAVESFASIVPEPTTLLLAGGGMLLVLGGRRRRVRDHV